MSFKVVCHECEQIPYQGRDMIPRYRLRRKSKGRCSACGRKLAVDPLSIKVRERG